MLKRITYIVLLFSLIFLLSCKKQDYKRIAIEERLGLEREVVVEHSVPGQVYLELDSKYAFYPSFFHNGEIYGHIKRIFGEDSFERKYLYKVDTNNKLGETTKENFNYLSGTKPIGYIGDQVYTVDYSKRSRLNSMPTLSIIIKNIRQTREENNIEISYVSGSEKYLELHEISPNGKLNNIYLYDIYIDQLYIKEDDNKYGEICYVEELRSLIWIDQEDFKIYKVLLKDGYYTLEEYIDLKVDKDIDRVRGIMKNGYELILLHDSKIGNKDEWNLMETSLVTNCNFRTKKYTYLFEKPIDENLYVEYLGNYLFISEGFDVFENYIEPTKRKVYYYNFNEFNMVYSEDLQDNSQQLYPDIKVVANRNGREIFSIREIMKLIDGTPITESVIYQRINLNVPKSDSY